MGGTGLIAGTQPVFMWCHKLDVGAHHACWLLLHALFITASVPTATTATATRTMTKGLFIVTSRKACKSRMAFRRSTRSL